MKKLLYLLLMIGILNCTKKNNSDDFVNVEPLFPNGSYPTTKLDTSIYKITRHYSLIDTVTTPIPELNIGVKYDDGSTVSVTWKINNITYKDSTLHTYWNGDISQWVSYNAIQLGTKKIEVGDKISVEVAIDNKSYNQEITMKENKRVSDVLGLNFGVTKNNVSYNELERLKLFVAYPIFFFEYLPNTATIFSSSNINYGMISGWKTTGTTIYRFQNNLLVEVGEYNNDDVMTDSLLNYCRKIGLKETPEISEDGKIDRPYTWNNEKIEFTLSTIDDAQILENNTRVVGTAVGVSYRKM